VFLAGKGSPAETDDRMRPLTARQSQVLRGLLGGLTNKEIALSLNVSESSVKAVIQELFQKAGVRTRSQLVRIAIEKHSSDWLKPHAQG
jgi:two-component system, NarL family, nitrate/nitrite response regulator NarL